jgi:hypothetical protein
VYKRNCFLSRAMGSRIGRHLPQPPPPDWRIIMLVRTIRWVIHLITSDVMEEACSEASAAQQTLKNVAYKPAWKTGSLCFHFPGNLNKFLQVSNTVAGVPRAYSTGILYNRRILWNGDRMLRQEFMKFKSSWLRIRRSRVRFLGTTRRKKSIGSGTGSTQPREYNWGATWKK